MVDRVVHHADVILLDGESFSSEASASRC